MSTFFGVVSLDNSDSVATSLQRMLDTSVQYWKYHCVDLWHQGRFGLGQLLRCVTPEDEHEVLPLSDAPFVLNGSFYLTNRDELIARLDGERRACITDAQLVLMLWRRFGSQTLQLLDGWWALALYNSHDESLTIAQCASKGVMYYCQTPQNFYFSTSVHEILCQQDVSREPNMPYLLEGFVNCRGAAREYETGYSHIFQLGRGYSLVLKKHHVRRERWWRPELLSPLQLNSKNEYDEAFAEMFDRHVNGALRSSSTVVASHLSGGLDSSSVLAAAQPELRSKKKRVIAFTHIPHFNVAESMQHVQANEWPLAAIVASKLKVEHIGISCAEQSIFDAIELDAKLHASPAFGTNNLYWLHEINRQAVKKGANICLTGQAGNASISYYGDPSLWQNIKRGELRFVWDEVISEHGGWRRGLTSRILIPLLQGLRFRKGGLQYQRSAAEFLSKASRRSLSEYFGADHEDVRKGFRTMQHLGLIRPGNQVNSEYFGVSIVDPTSLKGVMEFCRLIPDSIAWRQGEQRAMIRTAMQQRLPKDILYPDKKGRQSADLADRLSQQYSAYEPTLVEHLKHPLVREVFAEDFMTEMHRQLVSNSVSGVKLSQITRSISLMVFLSRF